MKNRIASTGVIGKIASMLESKTTKALRRIIEETDAARPADDADPAQAAVKNLTEEELALDDSTVTKESENNDEMSDDELDELMSEEDEDPEEVDESDDEDEDDAEEVNEADCDEEDEDPEEVDESDDEDEDDAEEVNEEDEEDEDEAEMKAEARRRALRARRSGR